MPEVYMWSLVYLFNIISDWIIYTPTSPLTLIWTLIGWKSASEPLISPSEPRNAYVPSNDTSFSIPSPFIDTSVAPKIINGDEATPHAYPWKVKLYGCSSVGCWQCGGSIISASWVLTAAHCVERGQEFTIVAGAHNLNAQEDSRIRITSREFIIHEDYVNFRSHDIALIKMPTEITFNEYIQPICLSDYEALVGSGASAMGWGKTETGQISPTLQVVHGLPVMSNEEVRRRYYSFINDGHICVDTSGPKGTCNVSFF